MSTIKMYKFAYVICLGRRFVRLALPVNVLPLRAASIVAHSSSSSCKVLACQPFKTNKSSPV